MASKALFDLLHGSGKQLIRKTATVVVDYRKHPYAADNIWHAQKSGWEKELTFRRLTKKDGQVIRKRTMEYEFNGERYKIPVFPGCDRDEYPMACTYEGTCPTPHGRQVWVGSIPLSENRSVGATVMNVVKKNKLQDGDKLVFTVTNHPNDTPFHAADEASAAIQAGKKNQE